MSYEIRWDDKARDFMRTLEKNVAARIFQKVNDLKDNPLHFLDKLVEINSYKL